MSVSFNNRNQYCSYEACYDKEEIEKLSNHEHDITDSDCVEIKTEIGTSTDDLEIETGCSNRGTHFQSKFSQRRWKIGCIVVTVLFVIAVFTSVILTLMRLIGK